MVGIWPVPCWSHTWLQNSTNGIPPAPTPTTHTMELTLAQTAGFHPMLGECDPQIFAYAVSSAWNAPLPYCLAHSNSSFRSQLRPQFSQNTISHTLPPSLSGHAFSSMAFPYPRPLSENGIFPFTCLPPSWTVDPLQTKTVSFLFIDVISVHITVPYAKKVLNKYILIRWIAKVCWWDERDRSQEGSLRRVLYLLKYRTNTSPFSSYQNGLHTNEACKSTHTHTHTHTHPEIHAHTLLQAIACAMYFPLVWNSALVNYSHVAFSSHVYRELQT